MTLNVFILLTGGARAGDPSGWIGVRPLALQRVWDDLPVSAARRGTPPRSLWAGRHEAERDGAEQRPLRATRRQLDTNARDVLDHARPDLDQALSDRALRATVVTKFSCLVHNPG